MGDPIQPSGPIDGDGVRKAVGEAIHVTKQLLRDVKTCQSEQEISESFKPECARPLVREIVQARSVLRNLACRLFGDCGTFAQQLGEPLPFKIHSSYLYTIPLELDNLLWPYLNTAGGAIKMSLDEPPFVSGLPCAALTAASSLCKDN